MTTLAEIRKKLQEIRQARDIEECASPTEYLHDEQDLADDYWEPEYQKDTRWKARRESMQGGEEASIRKLKDKKETNYVKRKDGGGDQAAAPFRDKELTCNECNGNENHQRSVVVFSRTEDATVEKITEICCITGEQLPSPDDLVNPSARRDGVSILIECEYCGHIGSINVAQHKGHTLTTLSGYRYE